MAAEAPAGLRSFWERTLDDARERARPTIVRPVETGLRLAATFDVTFSGFAGEPIRAWYHRPADAHERLPIVVRYQGYGNGRGEPHDVSHWVLAGYACLEVDTRGQGAGSGPHRSGHTADSDLDDGAFVTRGILASETYYYRRVYTDAVLAVEAAARLPGVDPDRVAVTGESQGGGISLAVAALCPRVAAAMPDVPFLSDFRRGVELAREPPYGELSDYLAAHPDRADRVFATLAYFDVAILARGAQCPALFSVALKDAVCPPATVYAAYDAYAGPKQIRCYPSNGHEGGQGLQRAEQLRWLSGRLARETPASAVSARSAARRG